MPAGNDTPVLAETGLLDVLRGATQLAMSDPLEVQRQIVSRIIDSSSIEDAFAEPETHSAQESVGVPLRVYGVSVARSKFKEGGEYYIICDAEDLESSQRFIMTTSAAKIMARLAWAADNGRLPLDVVIRESDGETASGFKVLDVALHAG